VCVCCVETADKDTERTVYEMSSECILNASTENSGRMDGWMEGLAVCPSVSISR
jgi:hypothetical protein